MQSCLGLYIEPNLIKYAKVTKDHNDIKIDSFGMKFYDKINDAIKQIIEETYSYKIPISVNLSDESYNYFYMFSLLNKKDLIKAIDTEFESFCSEQSINKNAFESRYMLVDNIEDKEKIKVIFISANKTEISRKTLQFEGSKLVSISPLPISISNILDISDKEKNVAIVNIENKTTVTLIINQKIYEITKFEDGMQEILDKIEVKENSYSKAYEICKGTTIYTSAGQDLQMEENEYLEDIMPTLYNIVGHVRKILNESLNKIDKIYLTGTASCINNIDLYFQEYLNNTECVILKPYFIQNISTGINIKDYIEVNSAIALALQGLDEGVKEINFKESTLLEDLTSSLNFNIPKFKKENKEDVEKSETKKESKIPKIKIQFNLGEKLDKMELNLLRTAASILAITIIFCVFSTLLYNQINSKDKEASEVLSDTNTQIAIINSDIDKIKTKNNQYIKMMDNLQNINTQVVETYKTKNSIPNLLNQVMFAIPKEVKLTSIENTSEKHIVIQAESSKYEQLGYFKAKLKTDGILENVVSSSGNKADNVIKITIEGDLP